MAALSVRAVKAECGGTIARMRLLLHACCGPCLLEPFDSLTEVHEVEVVYANPNIHPAEEYERRRDTLVAYALRHSIRVRELQYEPARWAAAVAGVADDRAQRCRACYELRMTMTAEEASRDGFDAIATTLTVSPYQEPEGIRQAGENAAARAGVVYVDTDFRGRYAEATRRSRELGMYRQNYCGCSFSAMEAEEERERRRALRREARRSHGG